MCNYGVNRKTFNNNIVDKVCMILYRGYILFLPYLHVNDDDIIFKAVANYQWAYNQIENMVIRIPTNSYFLQNRIFVYILTFNTCSKILFIHIL